MAKGKGQKGEQSETKDQFETQTDIYAILTSRRAKWFYSFLFICFVLHAFVAVKRWNKIKQLGQELRHEHQSVLTLKRHGVEVYHEQSVLRRVVGGPFLGCDVDACMIIGAVRPSDANLSYPDERLSTVNRIATKLVRAMSRHVQSNFLSEEWEIYLDRISVVVFESSYGQAKAFPSTAEVFVSSAIVDRRTESHIAFALGHEFGHMILGHTFQLVELDLSHIWTDSIILTLPSPLAILISPVRELWKEHKRMRREHWRMEFTADRFSLMLSAKAGYDPLVVSEYFAFGKNRLVHTPKHPPEFRRHYHLLSLREQADHINATTGCGFFCFECPLSIADSGFYG